MFIKQIISPSDIISINPFNIIIEPFNFLAIYLTLSAFLRIGSYYSWRSSPLFENVSWIKEKRLASEAPSVIICTEFLNLSSIKNLKYDYFSISFSSNVYS